MLQHHSLVHTLLLFAKEYEVLVENTHIISVVI